MKRSKLITAILALLLTMGLIAFSHADTGNYVYLRVNNPYSMDVQIELKCDWDDSKKEYKIHRMLHIKAKTMPTIVLPRTMRNCEMWPHIEFIGGKQ
jgi:hypothetical protein